MSEPRKTLVLIDGHSNLHRAYHAIKQTLTNSRGEPTSAVYGFLNMFLRMRQSMPLDYVLVVFDAPGPSFRNDLFDQYKANRPPAPEDLIAQDRRVREMLALMGVPVLQAEDRLEADDVLASLAVRAVEHGGEATVCSPDKDLLQVVRPGIMVWRYLQSKEELMDEEAVVGKLGVRPEQVPAYLGLVGDSSDNIPGVPSVGPKTASQLLSEYGTLEAILAAAPSIKKKGLSAKLQEHADAARLSEQLATLRMDAVPEFSWESYRWQFAFTPELRDFFREMEFRTSLEELGGPGEHKPKAVSERTTDYRTIRSRADLRKAVSAMRKAGTASIDTETTGLDPFEAELVGISISWEKDQAVYLPVGHAGGEEQLPLEDVRAELGPLLADPDFPWVAHHWNFDFKILAEAGMPAGSLAGGYTLLAAYLLNPDRSGSLRLKDLVLTHLNIKMTEISELIGQGDDMVTMAGVTIEDTARYACQDADATLQLHGVLAPRVAEAGMEKVYREVELPLTPVLARMELEGVRLDREHFRRLSREAEGELSRLTEEIHALAGRPFRINSPKQLAEVLFEDLGLPRQRKGKSGTYSTDVNVLEALRHMHPLPAKMLEYRQVEKLKNTYLDPMPSLVQPRTGRLHTSFNQTQTATGRLSSSNPNLQNIPVRTEAGRKVRRGFLSRADGWVLLSADYSQIELRILAHLSGDDVLQDVFRSGGDIHRQTAAKVFGVSEEDVTAEMRGQAKAINFGIVYGMTEFRLARDLEIPRAKAERFIKDYFAVYSGVRDYIEGSKAQAREKGYVTTLLGRRRHVPDINARNANQRNLAERIAVNTPIQGTSADMIKLAMIRVQERLDAGAHEAKMILQVHDELILDVPEEEVEQIRELVTGEMQQALPLKVPVAVETAVGTNWADCK